MSTGGGAAAAAPPNGADANNELTNTLLAAGSRHDPNAEALLSSWEQQNYAEFGLALANEIAAPNRPAMVRQMAGLCLKNMLAGKSMAFVQQKQASWKKLSPEQRGHIKQALLRSMECPEEMAAHSAAIAASEVAAVELPYNEWNEFVPALMDRVTNNQNPEIVSLASLQCLGYTAERISDLEYMLTDQPELPTTVVDKMLTTIVDGVQPTRTDKLRHAAITALKNSLAFVRKNMDVKSERDFIMNAICEATRCQNAQVREMAYSCMDQIAEFYYEKLQDYMTVIFQLTTEAIKTDGEDSVKMSAIEFWSTVAYVELPMIDEEKECQEEGRPLDRQPCPKYTQSAMETLTPLLLATLSQQDEDIEDDNWNLQAAGAMCLENVSITVGALIVPHVMPFVEQNIGSENWRMRDAAIVAFASILDGPTTEVIATFVTQAVPVLLQAFRDPNVVVRDSATHAISKICNLHSSAIPGEMLLNIIQGLIEKLSEQPRVAAHSCFAIFYIAQSVRGDANVEVPETNVLSPAMLPLLQALLNTTDRQDSVDSNLRISAISACCELVHAAARDQQRIFRDLLPNILERMDAALKIQVVSKDDNENKEQLLGLLCALITVLFQRLDKNDILPLADRSMECLLQVLQARNSNCYEEALLGVGALAGAIDESFVKYLPHFMPALLQGLKSFQAQSLCIVSVGVVVDVCTSVGNQIQPYCDDVMGALREALQDASVSRDVKPAVISCFGDIAMAIGAAYEPYLQVSVMMLMQAAQQSAPAGDEDLLAFINSLRLSILEAYSGIIFGLAEGNALHLFASNVPAIMQFLQFLSTPASLRDDEVLCKAVTLIGDIAKEMAHQYPQVKQQLNQPFVFHLIQEASTMDSAEARENANWTHNVLQQTVNA